MAIASHHFGKFIHRSSSINKQADKYKKICIQWYMHLWNTSQINKKSFTDPLGFYFFYFLFLKANCDERSRVQRPLPTLIWKTVMRVPSMAIVWYGPSNSSAARNQGRTSSLNPTSTTMTPINWQTWLMAPAPANLSMILPKGPKTLVGGGGGDWGVEAAVDVA